MGWAGYAISMLAFSLISMIFLYALQRLQWYLPLNPQGLAGVPPGLAFNTAASFTTNTNWQAYSGEQTLSYLTQMVGLTSHNFLSAAAGIAMAAAVIRGFARRSAKTIGNFWVDLTRTTLWVLLPLSLIFALVLVWQGVPDNFSPYVNATTLEGAPQSIAEGPVASQEIIKELGTNGGGFMNANSAHPYENPTPLTNLIEMLAIFAIGAGLTHTFGKMVGDRKQGWALFAVMAILFLAGAAPAIWAEQHGNPQFARMGIDQHASATQSGGNMEGKETRFGIVESAMWATATTDTSCGAVNSMHDSYTPLGGLVPLINMQLGEVIFGGVGSGLVRDHRDGGAGGVHRGPDGGADAGVPRQKNRSARDEAGDALRADLPGRHSDSGSDRRRHTGGPVEHFQSRAARLLANPVRVHGSGREQRVGLRRPERQRAVLQRDHGVRDVARPVHDGDSRRSR